MDPDVTLREIRRLITTPPESDKHRLECLEQASQMMYDLDTWITNGGLLPVDWDR